MEREVIFTGIGGQGIQLIANVLARAAAKEGKEVMLFGVYEGMMRGGSSESTVVIGDDVIQAPPIIPFTWSVLAMHSVALEAIARKLRPGGVLVVNSTLIASVPRHDVQVVEVPATKLAEQAGNLMGAGMIALAAFCAVTQLVGHGALVQAMHDSLPSHRKHHAERNVAFLEAGRSFAQTLDPSALAHLQNTLTPGSPH
ncbi:MAG: 2-oxoacid:acceptor oxidoreductase family protein [Deltaproteobacteria bacterium]|nr:2-oxoacid:acceptor oxidoreductase family protein [Deltaproteobacteria bacterium]